MAMEALVRYGIENTCNDVTRANTIVFNFIGLKSARLGDDGQVRMAEAFRFFCTNKGSRRHNSHVSNRKSNQLEIRRHFSVPMPVLMAVEDFCQRDNLRVV